MTKSQSNNNIRAIPVSFATLLFGITLAGIALAFTFLVDRDSQFHFIKHYASPFNLLLIVVLVTLLTTRARVLVNRRQLLWAGAAILVVYFSTAFREPFGFKVLQDEAALSTAAMNIHYRRINETPYYAHNSGGHYRFGPGFTDKRALLYPTLVSLAHDVSGFRIYNAYYINSILYLVSLVLIYWLVVSLTRKPDNGKIHLPGLFAALLFASLPLTTQNASGGGFELLNTVMVLALLLAGVSYTRQPDRLNLAILLVITLLLTNVRYESLIFVLFTGLVILAAEIRHNVTTSRLLLLVFVLLLVPSLLQIKIIIDTPGLLEARNEDIGPFSLSYLQWNLGGALAYMFDTTAEKSNNPVLFATGFIAIFSCLGSLFSRNSAEKTTTSVTHIAAIWTLICLAQFFIVLLFHDGDLNRYITSRYVLTLAAAMAVCAGIIYARVQHFRIATFVAATLLLFSFYQFYLPATAKHEYSLQNYYNKQTAWVLKYIDQQHLNNPLVISAEPWVYMLHKLSSTQIKAINHNPDKLAFHMQYETFDDILIIQNVLTDPATGNPVYARSNRLDASIVTQEVNRLNIGPFEHTILSRVTGFRQTETPAGQPQRKSDTSAQAVKPFELNQPARDLWHDYLP